MRANVVERLVALRKRSKKTATEVSLAVGHSRHYISRVENGLIFPRSLDDLEKILKVYDSNLEELFYSEFKEYNFEQEMLEKFRCMSKKSKDVIMSFIYLVYENSKEEGQRKKEKA